jgi:hypothetical protein
MKTEKLSLLSIYLENIVTDPFPPYAALSPRMPHFFGGDSVCLADSFS